MGLIPEITKLALHHACSFLTKHTNFSGNISINIKASELLEPMFEKDIMSIIRSYHIEPSKIELEILENDLVKDIELATSKINSLQERGISLSIDDFGTGYSSITYLKQLPVQTLKIDRSFTQNLHEESNRELVKLMINIAKTFNMKVVVEGVESEIHLAFIRDYGAEIYQGFYFSQAVPEENFIELLAQN
jgi:EAL domain-containing protein (putative c-di-GMP-specific phosphodiesterase class I)